LYQNILFATKMLRLPKGTQDYYNESYEKLDHVKKIIENIFKKYRGQFVETPVFEKTDVLTNKYGDEEKLIFNLEVKDESIESSDIKFKEALSLRYDHTIPLVRFCISNKIDKIRRCCIGKVYRREAITRKQIRLREFYQADFDYVGVYDVLLPELEIFQMIQELFNSIGISNYTIIYNYRQNLDYYIRQAGIDLSSNGQQMFLSVCSSIDKLDKKTPEEIRIELLQKGVTSEQIDILYSNIFASNPVMEKPIQDLDDKFRENMGYLGIDMSKIKLVPTLARGADYYTGIIFEVKLTESTFTSSVAGGGRYDKLVSSYQEKKRDSDRDRNRNSPMIGFSFGIDRLLPFIQFTAQNVTRPKIWIATIGKFDNQTKVKLEIVKKIRDAEYDVCYNLSDRKFNKEITDAITENCTAVIIVGEKEYNENKVTIKNLLSREQNTIEYTKLVEYVNAIYNA